MDQYRDFQQAPSSLIQSGNNFHEISGMKCVHMFILARQCNNILLHLILHRDTLLPSICLVSSSLLLPKGLALRRAGTVCRGQLAVVSTKYTISAQPVLRPMTSVVVIETLSNENTSNCGIHAVRMVTLHTAPQR